jgi:hypothetical protein
MNSVCPKALNPVSQKRNPDAIGADLEENTLADKVIAGNLRGNML